MSECKEKLDLLIITGNKIKNLQYLTQNVAFC